MFSLKLPLGDGCSPGKNPKIGRRDGNADTLTEGVWGLRTPAEDLNAVLGRKSDQVAFGWALEKDVFNGALDRIGNRVRAVRRV